MAEGRAASEGWYTRAPFRIVVTRAVTDEETVSLEAVLPSYQEAEEVARQFVRVCHDARRDFNQRVANVHRRELRRIERLIVERQAELAALNAPPRE